MEQRSAEWFAAKCGKVGCSRLGDVLAFTAKGESKAAREDYMMELLCERLTGQTSEHFMSDAIRWGVEQEPFGREAYMVATGNLVQLDGGRTHPEIKDWWCSPDGLVGNDGSIELKCPATKTHLATILYGEIDTGYIYQMCGPVLFYDRQWIDFVSYDPRLSEKFQVYVKRFPRAMLPLKQVEDGVKKFLAELAAWEKKLDEMPEIEMPLSLESVAPGMGFNGLESESAF